MNDEDLIEEILAIVEGNEENDWDCEGYEGNSDFTEIEKNYEHGGGEDEYLYMTHIFKYKDHYFSVLCCEASYGDSGYEWDTLKEVFPRKETITVYK